MPITPTYPFDNTDLLDIWEALTGQAAGVQSPQFQYNNPANAGAVEPSHASVYKPDGTEQFAVWPETRAMLIATNEMTNGGIVGTLTTVGGNLTVVDFGVRTNTEKLPYTDQLTSINDGSFPYYPGGDIAVAGDNFLSVQSEPSVLPNIVGTKIQELSFDLIQNAITAGYTSYLKETWNVQVLPDAVTVGNFYIVISACFTQQQ